jgi:formiminotetrahydrofolate cyclodeaminase
MSLKDLSIARFIEHLASGNPTPGGGSAAALAGALCAALGAMVARLTIGRKKYQDRWAAVEEALAELDGLSDRLQRLADQDVEAYNQVIAAFKLPKESEKQKAVRDDAVEAAIKSAALAPLETLKALSRLPELIRTVLTQGNANGLTDAGVAVQLMIAAAKSAAYNVRINASSLKDRAFAERALLESGLSSGGIIETGKELEQELEHRLG